jgi:CRP-like cAMP-binding protein
MITTIVESLRRVQIFSDLDDAALRQVANLCEVMQVPAQHVVFHEGDTGNHFFVVQDGRIRVSITTRDPHGQTTDSTINTIYPGQIFGEQVLLYGLNRSATTTAIEPTTLLSINVNDFTALCESAPHIGYRVMFQIASDLAYKLHSSNLLLRGNIRWQHDELGWPPTT